MMMMNTAGEEECNRALQVEGMVVSGVFNMFISCASPFVGLRLCRFI